MNIFKPVISLIEAFFVSQSIIDTAPIMVNINKHVANIASNTVDLELNKVIGQFMGTVKLRLVNDAIIRLVKTIDNIYKAYPCTLEDAELVDSAIKKLLSGHTESRAGKHLKACNPMPKGTTNELRSFGA